MANKATKWRRNVTKQNKADTEFAIPTTQGGYKVTVSHGQHEPKDKKPKVAAKAIRKEFSDE